jgi:hypothetical protein
MYENGVGVVAIGRVQEQWDGKTYTTPMYYKPAELRHLNGGPFEYRIAVEWFLNLSNAPIRIEQMREHFGYKPGATTVTRGTIDRIVKQREAVARLIEEARASLALLPGEPPVASDLEPAPTERGVTIVSRIVRDTELARRIKGLHGQRCQICDETVRLADGTGYAEGHHLQPLGSPHDGPDVAENIVCLCPNHHAACDLGAIQLAASDLRSVDGHVVGQQFIDYHNRVVYRGKKHA